MILAAVALGGALGAVARYLLAVRVYSLLGIDFPYGTLGVNVVGSLVLGVIVALVEERGALSPETRALISIGFLGGMTTFSTFVYEGWEFARDGELAKVALYAILSVAGAFLAFAAGHAAVVTLER